MQLSEVIDGQPVAYQPVIDFAKPAGKYAVRGLPPSADARSGYVGVQAHRGKVAFRNIRIRV